MTSWLVTMGFIDEAKRSTLIGKLQKYGTYSSWSSEGMLMQQSTHQIIEQQGIVAVGDCHIYYRNDFCSRFALQDDKSLSDIEVVCIAYRQWGAACFLYLEGDYAFVLYDQNRERIIAVRSLMGLKPLCYYKTAGMLLLASSPNIILRSGLPLTINADWVTYFLTTMHHLSGSIFSEIHDVEPGTFVIIEKQTLKSFSIWNIPTEMARYQNQQEAVEIFRSLLSDAVEQRCEQSSLTMADISGGLDSTTIAALATWKHSVHGIHFSSKDFKEKDESASALAVARMHGIPLHTFYAEDLPAYSDFDTPLFQIHCPNSALTVFGLYYQHIVTVKQQIHKDGEISYLRGTFGDQLALHANYRYLRDLWTEKRYLHLIKELYQWGCVGSGRDAWYAALTPKKKPESREALWIQRHILNRSAELHIERWERLKHQCPNPLNRKLLYHMQEYTEYVNLHTALAPSGLEVKDPFTDNRLIQFILSCPPQYQYRKGTTKFLLRAATKGILPEEVRMNTYKGRIARVNFTHIQNRHVQMKKAILQSPDWLSQFLDKDKLLSTLHRVVLGASVDQPAFFATLALIHWANSHPLVSKKG